MNPYHFANHMASPPLGSRFKWIGTTTVEGIAIKFGAGISVPLGVNCNHFVNPFSKTLHCIQVLICRLLSNKRNHANIGMHMLW